MNIIYEEGATPLLNMLLYQQQLAFFGLEKCKDLLKSQNGRIHSGDTSN